MRRKTLPWRVGLVATLALVVAPASALASSGWQVVPTPNPSSTHLRLSAVSALSPNDVWAVGSYRTAGTYRTLIEHYDGVGWGIVPSPNLASVDSVLKGVDAITSSNVWAVGYTGDVSYGPWSTLVLHWNGTAWRRVASPNAAATNSVLYGVSAVSRTDVWAVGGDGPSQALANTLTERWNGSAWQVVPSPNSGTNQENTLYAVSAEAGSDVWAVGEHSYHALTELWNGTAWHIKKAAPGTELYGVDAFAPSDVWAVGAVLTPSGQTVVPLTQIQHFDGVAWSVVPSPNVLVAGKLIANILSGVSGSSPSDIWAVGERYNQSTGTSTHALIEHWDGSSWTMVSPPNVSASPNLLSGVSADSSTDAWAVGIYYSTGYGGSDYTLAEHYSG